MYISLKTFLLLLFVAAITNGITIGNTKQCIQCIKYWSPEECKAMGKIQVPATCTACSACVPEPCLNCLYEPSEEQCKSQGKVLRPYSCHQCGACVDQTSDS